MEPPEDKHNPAYRLAIIIRRACLYLADLIEKEFRIPKKPK